MVSSKHSSYNQNLESEIPNEISRANDPPPPFDQASSSPVQVVSATPEVMPMKIHIVLSTTDVEIARMGVQETNIAVVDKNEPRVTEIGLLGGKGQDALPNPLERFASLATSRNLMGLSFDLERKRPSLEARGTAMRL